MGFQSPGLPPATIPPFMAKTKQTAQKSTGGRIPRKQVATKAARLSREERDAREAIMCKLSERTDVKKLSKTTGDREPYPYHVWVGMRLTRYDLNRSEMVRLFGRQIPIYLAARGDRGVLVDELSRLGLTESLDDGRPYDRIDDEAWDIESISFEDGKYVAVDHRDKSKHTILLYTLQVCGGTPLSGHQITNDKFYVNGPDRVSAYLIIDAWCQKHPGRWLSMSISGARSKSSSASLYYLRSLGRTPYQDKTNLCISAAICNSTHLLGAPQIASQYWRHFNDNAKLFVRHDKLPRRIRDLRDASKHLKQDEVVLKHLYGSIPTLDGLLHIHPGVFVVTLEGSSNKLHTVCISSSKRIILDCMEPYPLSFSLEALQLCLGGGVRLVEVREIREICLVQASTNNRRKRRKIHAKSSKSK